MPRKAAPTRTAAAAAPAPTKRPSSRKTAPAKEAPVAEQKAQSRARRAPRKEVVEEIVEEVEEEVTSDGEIETTTPGGTKKRFVPTKESVMEAFDEIVALIEEEIKHRRADDTKTKGVKFLRTLNKRVKTLRGQSGRVMKQKQKSGRKKNPVNSGFNKKVPVSKEMARFAGWDPKEEHSRVEVTKFLCKYIKDNDLQNPTDRRQIKPDAKLRKLLNYDPAVEEAPGKVDKKGNPARLRYYSMQTFMKPLFPSEDS